MYIAAGMPGSSSRVRRGSLPSALPLSDPTWSLCSALGPQHKDVELLEQLQRRPGT